MKAIERHRQTWQGKSDEWLFERLDNELKQKVEEIHRLLAENEALRQFDVTSWVAVSEKLPTVEDNGGKVLIYRIMNDSQSSLAISIHETNMVKHCNPNETWWMELPKPPCL